MIAIWTWRTASLTAGCPIVGTGPFYLAAHRCPLMLPPFFTGPQNRDQLNVHTEPGSLSCCSTWVITDGLPGPITEGLLLPLPKAWALHTQSRLTWVAGCVTFSAYSFSSCSVPITAGIFSLVVQPSAQPGIAVPAGKANEGLADGNSLLSWPCCTSPWHC